MNKDQLKDKYLNSVTFWSQLRKKEEKQLLILSIARLAAFTGGFVIIWLGFTVSVPAGIILILAFTILFLYLIILYSRHTKKREFFNNLIRINKTEADALAGDLSGLDTGHSYLDIHHDYSFDVDLFGPASLFQYLNRTVTGYGRDILAGWLSDPLSLSRELLKRQETIKELASKYEWRHKFMASGMKTPLEKVDISGLTAWLEERDQMSASSTWRFMVLFLPSLSVIALLLSITGILPYPAFASTFLVNLLFTAVGLRRINRVHNALSKRYNFLSSMNELLKAFEEGSFETDALKEIGSNISGKTTSAAVSVRKLGKLIEAFDSRNNMLTGFVLNGLLLWDYQSISRLEKWKSEYRYLFPLWLRMIGQVDAYISLGNYAYNNPDFAYPVISVDGNIFSAKDLGHQLIDEKKRICNDFSLGGKGTVCIISGANMAGKSTFLRTIAVNFILAMSGAPVCATEMSFLPVKLFTSMRTVDSLSDNESYFYAELRRLNKLKLRITDEENVFFILDEILKGTNSADKSTGSKLFLERIIEKNGTGLIATHDISLGVMESEHPGRVINKCFEIEIDGENISFDYKLRKGLTQKMNAVFLMRQMGILD